MTLHRYLDKIEMPLQGFAPPLTAEYSGEIDLTALGRAFEILCQNHPVLRACIRQDDHGYMLYVPEDSHPELVIRDGNETTLWQEPNNPWDPARALSRLILFKGDNRGFVSLRADHCIVDGSAIASMFFELWNLYSSLFRGIKVSPKPQQSLPVSPYELLTQRWGQISLAMSSDATRNNSPVLDCPSVRRRLVLSTSETTHLIAAAKTNRTSVYALVCGAIIVALRNLGTPRGPARMACWSAIDLRNRVTPSVGATESTNFSCRNRSDVTVAVNDDAIAVGREIKSQLDNAIARREVSINLSEYLSSQVETDLEQRLATLMISNMGNLSQFEQPQGLTITDLLTLTRRDVSLKFPTHAVFTFQGRLSVRCTYPSALFTEEEVDGLINEIAGHLTSC